MAAFNDLGLLFVLVLVIYFLVVISIGYYGYVRTKTEEDFLVAGRSIGPIVGGATLSATQMSAGTFVGSIGFHYLTGISYIWIWPGLWVGWLVSLVFVAPQMRRFGEITVPDFMAARYGEDGAGGRYIRAIAATLIVAGYLVYVVAEYTAGGIIFQTMFGIQQIYGISLIMLIALLYTGFGGMRASALTDFVQGVVMTVGAAVTVPVVLSLIGGFGQIESIFSSFQPTLVGMAFTPLELFGFMAAFGFYIAVSPNEVARIYSMRDEKTVRQAIGVTLIIQAIIAMSIAMIGVSMHVLFPKLSSPDLASIIMSVDVLGPLLGAILVAAVLSAIFSSIDSIMVTASSALAHDFYGKIINVDATEREKLWAGRIGVAIMAVLPFLLTTQRDLLGGLVQLIIVLQVSMHGAMFFAPLLLGLHWKRANTAGGLASMVTGFMSVVIWHAGIELGFITGGLAAIQPVLVGLGLSIVAMLVFTYAGSEPSRESLERFFDLEEAD